MSLLQKHKLCTTKTLQGIEHLHIVINFLQIKQLKLTITLYYPFQDFHFIIRFKISCQRSAIGLSVSILISKSSETCWSGAFTLYLYGIF